MTAHLIKTCLPPDLCWGASWYFQCDQCNKQLDDVKVTLRGMNLINFEGGYCRNCQKYLENSHETFVQACAPYGVSVPRNPGRGTLG